MSSPSPASPFFFKPLELSHSDDTTLDRYYAAAAVAAGGGTTTTFPFSPTSSPTSIMIFREVVVTETPTEDNDNDNDNNDGDLPSCWEHSSAVGLCPGRGGGGLLLQRANPICDEYLTPRSGGPMDDENEDRDENEDHNWSGRRHHQRVVVSPTLMVLDYHYASEESMLLMPKDDDEGRPDGEEGCEAAYCGLSPIKLDYSRFFVDADHHSSLTPPSWTGSELRSTPAAFFSSPEAHPSSSLSSDDDDDDDDLECNDDDFSLSSQEAHSMMDDENDDLGVDDPAAVWEAGIPVRDEPWSSPPSSSPSSAPHPHPTTAGRCHSIAAPIRRPPSLPSL